MKRILTVLFALVMLCSTVASAEDSELTVNGSGRVYMDADYASIYLGVSLSGEDVASLQSDVNETIEKICATLQQAGIAEKNISTNYIYISPRYDYSGETEKLVGYTISNSLLIITDNIDQLGSYIDMAFEAGANTFDSINFSVKDSSAARKQALELAIADAREKAEVIANAMGKTLGEALDIHENNEYNYYYGNGFSGASYAAAEGAVKDTPTTVRASQVEVSAGVEICFDLK